MTEECSCLSRENKELQVELEALKGQVNEGKLSIDMARTVLNDAANRYSTCNPSSEISLGMAKTSSVVDKAKVVASIVQEMQRCMQTTSEELASNEARLAIVESSVESYVNDLATAKTQLMGAEHKLASAEQKLAVAEKNLESAQVKSLEVSLDYASLTNVKAKLEGQFARLQHVLSQNRFERLKYTAHRVAATGDLNMLPGIADLFSNIDICCDEESFLCWCAEVGVSCAGDLSTQLCIKETSDLNRSRLQKVFGSSDVDAVDRLFGAAMESLSERQKARHQRSEQAQHSVKELEALLAEAREEVERLKSLQQASASASRERFEADIVRGNHQVKQLPKELRQARRCKDLANCEWVLCSTPIRDMEGVNIFKGLCDLCKQIRQLVICCDWAGSKNARQADTPLWNRLFGEEGEESLIEVRNTNQSADAFAAVKDTVTQTLWWHLYKGLVKGGLRTAAMSGSDATVVAVCIQGGPISRVEASEMESIVEEVKFELAHMGMSERTVQVHHFPTLSDFEAALQAGLPARPPGKTRASNLWTKTTSNILDRIRDTGARRLAERDAALLSSLQTRNATAPIIRACTPDTSRVNFLCDRFSHQSTEVRDLRRQRDLLARRQFGETARILNKALVSQCNILARSKDAHPMSASAPRLDFVYSSK